MIFFGFNGSCRLNLAQVVPLARINCLLHRGVNARGIRLATAAPFLPISLFVSSARSPCRFSSARSPLLCSISLLFSSARSPCLFSSVRSPCLSPPAGNACARLLPFSASISSRSAFRRADLVFSDEIYLPVARSEHIRDLEREEEEQKKIQEQLRRAKRKNRDEFRKLMEGHVASGILTAKIHWRNYCMKVKELPAYIAVSSNTYGSTPKGLFEDVAEELEKQV